MIDHILRTKCLLKHVIERKLDGRLEVTRRRGLRIKQLLDEFISRKCVIPVVCVKLGVIKLCLTTYLLLVDEFK